MVNLLFISNSAKIDRIRNVLQPFLKVKIDVVGDFDFGLKDVFEKRPATVFIQDQIDGVTGESVARHIQMLLGTGAPSFIFMHGGSPKAKPIKGLFEYLIDLTQADAALVEDIQATLKSLLGPQWEKIYIPPKMDKTVIKGTVAVPEGDRDSADKLVDDFISDLDCFKSASDGTNSPSVTIPEPLMPGDEPFHVVSSPHEQLAEMLFESSRDPGNVETTATAQDIQPNSPNIPPKRTVVAQQAQQETLATAEVVSSASVQPQATSKNNVPEAPVTSTTSDLATVSPIPLYVPEKAPPQQVSPADFVIDGEKLSGEVAPEELLRVFEGNYCSHTAVWRRVATIVVILIMCACGGAWYLSKQKPLLLPSMFKPSVQHQQVVAASAPRPPAPAGVILKPVPPPASMAEASKLPTFIPQAGIDSSYAIQKPGWERYVSSTLEFRIYRPNGKIRALQVLGIKNNDISEPKLKSILIELIGDGEYRVKSTGQKLGFQVSRAIVGQKAELLIYRKKDVIRAFVVSLD